MYPATARNPVDEGMGIWGSTGVTSGLGGNVLPGGITSQKYISPSQVRLKTGGVFGGDIVEGGNVGDNVDGNDVGANVERGNL